MRLGDRKAARFAGKEEWDVNTNFKLMLAGGSMALALTLSGPAMAAEDLNATLSGANETKGGDADGSGTFWAEVDLDTGDVCYLLDVNDIGSVTAAHIHKGLAGKDGKPVHALDVTGPDDDLCFAMEPEKLQEIVAAPGAYYVNVHTADFPAGAIRGQFDGPTAPPKAEAEPEGAADDAGGGEGASDEAGGGDEAASAE